MPLSVNLRHLEAQDLRLQGDLSVEELDYEARDAMIQVEQPLHYDLAVQKLEKALLVQGRLQLTLRCQCVRCLKPFALPLRLNDWTRHVPLEGEEKPVQVGDCVDLTPFVREDILLEFPQHPLCEANCPGLSKPESGKAKKSGSTGQGKEKSSAWSALDKLKF